MKTILVDAVFTFVSESGDIFTEMQTLLDSFGNRKIILTNANAEERVRFGLERAPYEVFSLDHEPNKVEPVYYEKMLEHFGLQAEEVVYFEHDETAVQSAQSVGITTYHYDAEKKDLHALETFLRGNL